MHKNRVVTDGISAFLSLSAEYLGLDNPEPGSRTAMGTAMQPPRRLTSTAASSYPLGERHRCSGRYEGRREAIPGPL